MRIDLRNKDLDRLRSVLTCFPAVKSARIFGSRANGTATRASDIDLAVEAPALSGAEWSRLKEAIEEAPIIYEIDVVRVDDLQNAALREKIEREGVEI
ncbi:MAG: nucleotidyltransferase domain-containing protein [Myxococcota bacterium]|jgi:predicted nucleotidyltransferase